MKKGILLVVLALAAASYLSAQDVVWSEDFNGGSNGWTVRSTLCGTFTGGAIGRWELQSATLNGSPIAGLTGELSVNTNIEYSVRFTDGTNRGEAQARYTLTAGVWGSNLNGVTIPLNGSDNLYDAATQETPRFTNMSISQAAFNSWGATFLGLNSPTVAIAGAQLTVTSADGTVVLTFNKLSDCGAYWWWTPNGNVGAGALVGPTVAITSPTASNGAMVMNADYMTTGGLPGGVPSGPPPYPQYTSELISPVIDLSAVDFGVSVRFHQLVRILNVSSDAPGTGLRTSIAYSIDGGATWSTPINANTGLAVNAAPLNVERVFTLPGVQGQSNVRIKFTWSADFYYWAIDDIALIEQPRYDMRVNDDFFSIMPNFATPVSQLDEYLFGADIENLGGRTATNVQLNLQISNAATSDVVYDDTMDYGNVPAGVRVENYIFPARLAGSALGIGAYTGRYEISLDSTDLFPANNVIEWNFVVTDSLFAKEGARTRTIAPAAEPSFTYGNIFYVPNGDGLYARYVSFGVGATTTLVGRSITTLLYRWEGDTNDNNLADPAEYGGGPIAFNSYEFTGTEASGIVTIPIDLDENPIPLEDGIHYIMAVQYITDDAVSFFIGGNGVLNYGATNYFTDSLNVERFHTALVVGANSNPAFSTVAFGYGITPQIRMSIGDNPDLSGPAFITSSTNEVVEANFLEVFPNPASEVVNLRLNLEGTQDVHLMLFDSQGRTVAQRKFENVSREIISLPVHSLPAGTYYVRLSTPNGANVRPIIINR